jgi:hypothetical protein
MVKPPFNLANYPFTASLPFSAQNRYIKTSKWHSIKRERGEERRR